MNKVSFILFLLVSLLIGSAHGQVVFPQGNAQWTVEITSHGTSSTPGPHPKHVVVTQLNGYKRVQIDWDNGTKSEKWGLPDMAITFQDDPTHPDGLVVPIENNSRGMLQIQKNLTYDSFAFDWINGLSPQEKDPISYEGKQCYHYVGTRKTQISNLLPVTSAPMEAWIDSKTHFPVALDDGESLSLFDFQEKPPTGSLTPPPKFAQMIHDYRREMGY